MNPDDLLKIADSFPWDEWAAPLRAELEPVHLSIAEEQGARTAAAHGLAWTNDDPALTRVISGKVGDAIVSIEGTTKNDVIAIIRESIADNPAGSPFELGSRIADKLREKINGDYPRWRADSIARTETGTAFNVGTVHAGRQNGVDRFLVSDGDCDICRGFDGQIWTGEHALANPLAHPNCTRSFSLHIE
jgi:hypothetical protein